MTELVYAGAPLPLGAAVAAEDEVIAALRGVFDPEIPVNIFDLGLIYGLAIGSGGNVAIRMTLTAPACPVAGALPQEVAKAVAAVPGVGAVAVTLAWDPPWDIGRMSEDARAALDL